METANPLGVAVIMAMQKLLPVGSIIEWCPVSGGPDLSTPAKVAAYYGFGEWEAFGAGRMTLGQSASHVVGSTGGEETHKLAADEMPNHAHDEQLDFSGFGTRPYMQATGATGTGSGKYMTMDNLGSSSGSAVQTSPTGGGQPHNNMPPFITVYRWRRIT